MFHYLNSLLHRHGSVLYANLGINSILPGDILTHRYNHQKSIVAHIGRNHLLLVCSKGRISRIRKTKAVRTYCRSTTDVHGRHNVRKALRLATDALVSDKRLFTLLGLRTVDEDYLQQIKHNVDLAV
ncbi:hypothetical protein [Neisseria canis]|uniref:Uncharacterized protein n=1 Tax=Neisseria canis TaxID=493 RepID=A0A1X3CZ62_9NEIS|nr:hypothetical protein [Neisseria canis]OSI12959.1 hypothetical protein BWD07_02490 [Neisseria canis]VEF02395.1 Uncharacterised protein [Neisseria canis]